MKTEWNLDILYTGLDDPKFTEDMKLLEACNDKLAMLTKTAESMTEKERLEAILLAREEYSVLLNRLAQYVQLGLSVNTKDGDRMATLNKIMRIYSEGAAANAALDRIIGAVDCYDELARESEIIREYRFLLDETKKHCAHLLSDEVEEIFASMDMTGGSAWGNLQSFLTSTLKVDYEGKQITLSQVRNQAYHKDGNVRKASYEAELAAYEKIQDSVAYALNNIKNQVTMEAKKRGYESPLAMTLEMSRMKRETLDAMMAAVEDYLPVFRKYLRKKAEILGHKNGLPWYELFAPLEESAKEYSLLECKDYLIECFDTLTPDMSAMIREAFENEWIDFYPREGKEGGAFCASLTGFKQSRILTNYDGTFGAVDTLAHELGHAFHNRMLEGEKMLNQDYPMPVAETASTFNEVHLGHYALSRATEHEKMALLENDLKENCQCIVDIYSRYLFETEVFEQSQNKFLMAEDLKEIMLKCQKKAYGDGLDPEYLHPYMWICKGHYYSSGLSFYNFPYTFGNLFAIGLHNLYEKQGSAFVENYKEMLRLTPVHTIEENGQMMGVDLTKQDFWRDSLQTLANEIEEFAAMK